MTPRDPNLFLKAVYLFVGMCVIAAGYLFIYICILCSRFRAKVQASPWWEIFVGLAACSFVLAFIAAGLYAAHFWR